MPLKPSDRLASLDACPKGITESPSKKHSRHTNCRQPQAPEPPGSLLFSRWHQVTTSCYPIVHLSCPAHLIPLLYQPILLLFQCSKPWLQWNTSLLWIPLAAYIFFKLPCETEPLMQLQTFHMLHCVINSGNIHKHNSWWLKTSNNHLWNKSICILCINVNAYFLKMH